MLTPAEKRRYNRHILIKDIGEDGQIKIKNSRVLVVGAGGIGTPVLQYLTAAGVGLIGIMDDDVVSEDNLHRQVLYGISDLGKLKAIIARERLSQLNPFVKFELLNIRLSESNAEEIISKFDVVVDATDSLSSRKVINEFCLKLEKPWVFGSVFQTQGNVSVFNFQKASDLEALQLKLNDKEVPNPSEYGLFGVLAGMVGAYQANEVLKIITGAGHVLEGKLLLIDSATNRFEMVEY